MDSASSDSASPARVKTAFVLAGGGSLGAIEVGMLKVLVSLGITPDLVVGSSVGAINAAYLAADPSVLGVTRLEAVWRSITRAEIFPLPRITGLMRLASGRGYLIDSRSLARVLRRYLPYDRLEDAKLPCCVIATDLVEGIEVRTSNGPAVDALIASTAIPGIFPPVALHGRDLVDGGVCNNTPVSAAVELGARRIYVLPTGYSCALRSPPRGAIARVLHSLNLLIIRQLISDVKRLRDQAEIIVVPPLCPVSVSPYDFGAAASLIVEAEKATRAWWAEGVESVDGIPHTMPPHSHREAADPYAAEWH